MFITPELGGDFDTRLSIEALTALHQADAPRMPASQYFAEIIRFQIDRRSSNRKRNAFNTTSRLSSQA